MPRLLRFTAPQSRADRVPTRRERRFPSPLLTKVDRFDVVDRIHAPDEVTSSSEPSGLISLFAPQLLNALHRNHHAQREQRHCKAAL